MARTGASDCDQRSRQGGDVAAYGAFDRAKNRDRRASLKARGTWHDLIR